VVDGRLAALDEAGEISLPRNRSTYTETAPSEESYRVNVPWPPMSFGIRPANVL
jgi:hypothetical protein